MYLYIEENKNCGGEERVLSALSEEKFVVAVNVETPAGSYAWCDITGVDEGGTFAPAKAVHIEDSGAGLGWLVFGGTWGIRFRLRGNSTPWDLNDKTQWGAPFKVLDSAGQDLQFS